MKERAILVGSLNEKGLPEKGTLLNWVNRPMGKRWKAKAAKRPDVYFWSSKDGE